MISLSILIPTLNDRAHLYRRLTNALVEQIRNGGYEDVEILSSRDNGTTPVGEKRQSLLDDARGRYIVFFDDDDTPSDDYLSSIMGAMFTEPDAIGFEFECYGYNHTRRNQKELAAVSMRYPGWFNNRDGYRYVRYTHHLVPVRREHAVRIGFLPFTVGEDHDYSDRLRQSGLIKSEVFIPRVLYTIWHDANKSRKRVPRNPYRGQLPNRPR